VTLRLCTVFHHGHRSAGRFIPVFSTVAATLPLSLCQQRSSPLIDGKNRRRTRKQVRHQLLMQTCLGISTCIGENGDAVVFIRPSVNVDRMTLLVATPAITRCLMPPERKTSFKVIAAEGAVPVLVHNNLIASGPQ